MKALHKKYPDRDCQWGFFNLGDNWRLVEPCREKGCDFHHKQLKSQGGKDEESNLVALCRGHHMLAHLDFSKLERIRQSGANLLNGETIS